MGYIYWIRTATGTYIGKYSDKYYMKYHMGRAEPFSGTKINEAWEKEWRNNLLSYGYNNDYIISTNYFEESIIHRNLINSFNKILKDTPYNISDGAELYDDIAAMWGRNQDHLAVSEALCILLGAKDIKNLLNTQVDFMTRKDLTNIDNFFNREEVKRIQSVVRKKWMPALFFTIDFKDFDIGKIDEQLEKQLQKAIGTKSGINVLKHPKVAAALLPALSATTIDHTIKQLNDYKKHLRENRHIPADSPIIRYVNSVIRNVKNGSFDNREQLIDFIKQQFSSSTWTKKVARNYNMETVDDKIDAILELLKLWYNNTSIDEILDFSSSNDDWTEGCRQAYKKDFTGYIQQLVFSVKPDNDYQSWKMNKWEEGSLKFKPGSFYPSYYRQQYEDEYTAGSLRSKTEDIINQSNNLFIIDNWDRIYPEQVAIFLTTYGCNFPSEIAEGSGGFITTLIDKNITVY